MSLAAAIRGISDADALAELCEAIRAAMEHGLERRGRICRADPMSGATDELSMLVGHVDRELEHATVACIRAQTVDEAQAQAIRCAAAAALLGEDEAARVAELVAEASLELEP